MKFFHLILGNLLRKKIRTTLTIGSFAVALFLFGVLAVVRGAFARLQDVAGADRLVVVNRVSPLSPLPISYHDRLVKIPGVKQVTSTWISPGFYQDNRIFFVQAAVDIENHRALYPEFIVPDAQWAAFVADREGAVIGEGLARRFNWKIGDRIPVKGPLAQGRSLEFNIRGIYRGTLPQHDVTHLWYQRKFLEERIPFFKGHCGWYIVRVVNPDQAARVVKAIDREFANSPQETRTNTENEFLASIVKQMGNIQFLMLSIGGVVFFTLLLVTGNTMTIAVRERVGELAILKALGFSDVFVLVLVLIESLVVAALGAVLGLGLAKLFTLRGDPTGGMLPAFYLPANEIVFGLALALLVGVVSGILPALSAMRLRVVETMRRV